MSDRLSEKLYRLFIVLLLLYVALSGFRPMLNQVDLGWQIAQGGWMLEHFVPYSHDVFNYPNLHHPVIDEYLLFEVVLFAACKLGWWGPCLLTVISYLALVIVLFGAGRDLKLRDSATLAVAVGLMLMLFSNVFPLRPHVITFLCVAVLGVFLLRHREAEYWTQFWPMALLQIAWVNSHSGFVIGPAMVGLFGTEITFRRWLAVGSFPIATARTWAVAFALILLACLINPYGWARFYPPFFQDNLESIRAYVSEMQPLTGGLATIFQWLSIVAGITVALALAQRRAIAVSFLLLAGLFLWQAQAANKMWPLFGLFIPLLVLSTGAFSTDVKHTSSWLRLFSLFSASVVAALSIEARLQDGGSSASLAQQWREYDLGRSELAITATNWMRLHHLEGRIFHRSEDGGWLQMNGYDHGETFADTGFGKYDAAAIHEIGLSGERPALLPRYLAGYQPQIVVCGPFCYQWPYYLHQTGWRLVFYSPNSSVWLPHNQRPDLPTVSPAEIMARFNLDLTEHGMPLDLRILGRNILALNSHGLSAFALATLTGLPDEFHHTAWYWEAARILCFEAPSFSSAQRATLMHEADTLQNNPLTAEFRAYFTYYAEADTAGARKILQHIPPARLSNNTAELLLKIYLDNSSPDTLALARRMDCFDLRNGRHWQYLAQAEEQVGQLPAARSAWQKAVFYYPDDDNLIQAATDFAVRRADADLTRAIAASHRLYGQQVLRQSP